jgi:hypothetical protein
VQTSRRLWAISIFAFLILSIRLLYQSATAVYALLKQYERKIPHVFWLTSHAISVARIHREIIIRKNGSPIHPTPLSLISATDFRS